MRLINLKGKKFGRLIVTGRSTNVGKKTAWRCKCDCGNKTVAQSYLLETGHVKSCGCLKESHGHTKGYKGTPTYEAWRAAKKRCFLIKTKGYKNYGGRGITMCQEWISSFGTFLKDMGIKPERSSKGRYTLDRIKNDGNYEPNNCRWATYRQQAHNRRKGDIGKWLRIWRW